MFEEVLDASGVLTHNTVQQDRVSGTGPGIYIHIAVEQYVENLHSHSTIVSGIACSISQVCKHL